MKTFVQVFSVSVLLLSPYGAAACRAADPKAPPTWRDGLRLLDSRSQADIVAAEHMLLQLSKQDNLPPEALCTLALLQLRQDKPAEALATVAALPSRYSASELQSTAALALRIQLYAALESDDGALADKAFKDLVRQIIAERANAERANVTDIRISTVTIAVVIAMLEVDRAQSPIAKRDRMIGYDCMLQSNLPGVSTAFITAYEQAKERSTELIRQFQLIEEKGIDAVAAENAARLEALNISLAQLTELKEMAAETFRNAREQTEQNTRDRRQIDRLISSINVRLRQPTPGHPGPQRRPPPPPPLPTSIYVDEYELRTEIEYQNANGQLVGVPVTREYRRSQADIDYERDAKYQRVLRDYERLQADYDRYITSYNQALKNWNEADRARRLELNNQRGEAEAKRAELLAENEQIKAEKSAAAKDVVQTRTAREQEEFELQLQAIALEAVRTQKIAGAFRPRNFPVLSWSQEKSLLLRSTQGHTSVISAPPTSSAVK